MNNSKKFGFTLGEVLLAVLITGVIAALTIPSVMKDIQQKTRMNLLKGMVGNFSNVVQSELTRTRTTEITDTDIHNNPKAFLERFDYNPTGRPFAATYKRYSDLKAVNGVLIPSNGTENQAVIALKNGVGLGIINYPENRNSAIIIDVNGDKEPNIIGADYFIFKMEWDDNFEKGYRSGDFSSYENGGSEGTETNEGLKTACKDGNGAACFRLVQLTSYEPGYLD